MKHLKKNRQLIADSGNGVGYVHTGNGGHSK